MGRQHQWTDVSVAKLLRASKDRKGWCELIGKLVMVPV